MEVRRRASGCLGGRTSAGLNRQGMAGFRSSRRVIKRLTASLPRTTVKVTGCPTISGVVDSAAQAAIRVACQQVGEPYVWGANGPDAFDCSGLTQYAYKAAGISLTRRVT